MDLADAYPICLALPAKFTQPGIRLLAKSCTGRRCTFFPDPPSFFTRSSTFDVAGAAADGAKERQEIVAFRTILESEKPGIGMKTLVSYYNIGRPIGFHI